VAVEHTVTEVEHTVVELECTVAEGWCSVIEGQRTVGTVGFLVHSDRWCQ
jgi:hypothetical protein